MYIFCYIKTVIIQYCCDNYLRTLTLSSQIRDQGRQIQIVSTISAWSIASRNRLLSRGQFRPKERVVPPGTERKAHHSVRPFSLAYRRGKARGGCGRHSTVTKGNHHRSGGTGTSSGHKLSKSRRYFAESSAKRTVLLVRWEVNKSVREVRYKLYWLKCNNWETVDSFRTYGFNRSINDENLLKQ